MDSWLENKYNDIKKSCSQESNAICFSLICLGTMMTSPFCDLSFMDLSSSFASRGT